MSISGDQIMALLRASGDDGATVEAKRASEGLPSSLATTLSAFANTPGGGLIVLGVDEAADFSAVGVYDPLAAQKAIASICRDALQPPVNAQSRVETVEGATLVVVEVHEAHASQKPVRIRRGGRAYLRLHDGDYSMSENEEQAFLASRTAPRFDAAVVDGATREDLDDDLVGRYVETCHESASLARFDREETLFRTGVLAGADRRPSVAGILALGLYPQQFFPNLVVQAHVAVGPEDPPGTRATDVRRFDGPIPTMLEDAMAWVRRSTRSRVVFGDDGHGRDRPEYPTEAVRELVANTLVHRDLGEHALGLAITLVLEPSKLVLSNPGGLFGITADRLGQEGVTSARNATLIRICQNVRFADGRRVAEALASGIPTAIGVLRQAQMTPPAFHDEGVRFTVLVPNHALLGLDDLEWLRDLGPAASGMSDTQRHALVAMRGGRIWTNREFRERFPMDSRRAQAELADLVERGFAFADGQRGTRSYRFADPRPGRTKQLTIPDRALPTSANEQRILDRLARTDAEASDIARDTGLSLRQVRYALGNLRRNGRVEIAEGGRGRRTAYRVLI